MKEIITKHLQSEQYAWSGLVEIFKTQPNFRIELLAGILVILLGFILRITTHDFIMVLFCISFVLISEALNSTIEKMCDVILEQYHEKIKSAKDISAAMVLISAITTVIVGIAIFLPYLLEIIK